MEELALKPAQEVSSSYYIPIQEPSIIKRPPASLILIDDMNPLSVNPIDTSVTATGNTTEILGKYIFICVTPRWPGAQNGYASNARLTFYINEVAVYALAMPNHMYANSFLINVNLPLSDVYLPINSTIKARFTSDNATDQGYNIDIVFAVVGKAIYPNDKTI